jgi:hypothetical protein
LIAALIGTAHIQAVTVGSYLAAWPAGAVFFTFISAADIALARMLLARLRNSVLVAAAAATSTGLLAFWVYSRTAGLPFGPTLHVEQGFGIADTMAAVLEVATLSVAVILLLGSRRLQQRSPVTDHPRGLALVAVIAITVIGLADSAPEWFDWGSPAADSGTLISHEH